MVENKPGAGNVIGAQAAARSAPDGYTFFFATSAALVTNPYMVKNLSYDRAEGFRAGRAGDASHQIVVVHPDVPAKTLAELIALDKAAPGKIVDGGRWSAQSRRRHRAGAQQARRNQIRADPVRQYQ